jgi:phenylpyruvate tautomerase PptA (4-oxalocrotonate tautomerase family)
MPLWRIFSHPQTFSKDQRVGIAQNVTELYISRGLPAFYVNVIFVDVDENGIFIGGEPKKNFVRIVIEQIARTMSSPDTEEGQKSRTMWMDMINDVSDWFLVSFGLAVLSILTNS